MNERVRLSHKNFHLSKTILLHKKPWLAALRVKAVLRVHEEWDRPRACLSVCTAAAAGGKMRAGQTHEESKASTDKLLGGRGFVPNDR